MCIWYIWYMNYLRAFMRERRERYKWTENKINEKKKMVEKTVRIEMEWVLSRCMVFLFDGINEWNASQYFISLNIMYSDLFSFLFLIRSEHWFFLLCIFIWICNDNRLQSYVIFKLRIFFATMYGKQVMRQKRNANHPIYKLNNNGNSEESKSLRVGMEWVKWMKAIF